MITKFKIFEKKINYLPLPDLRKIGEVVLCIKDLYLWNFKKGKYYKVVNFTGDITLAINRYGINDYLPVECI